MKIVYKAAFFAAITLTAATSVLAQDATTTAATPPAVQDQTGAIGRDALLEGENSFTEGQAKDRIEASGFTNVGTLKLDERGIWRGRADRGATTVEVGLDFKGTVAALGDVK